MISASNVRKVFGAITAIEDVSFHLAAGEVVGFLGPNGAGKTTTMRILAGIFPPTSGEVSVAGHNILENPMEARRAIGYFPEYAPFYPDLSVEQYLQFVGRLKRLDRRRRRDGVAEVLSSCGLKAVARRLVGKLSKGYRQRVGIAQALLGDPPILILDEPTIGLDPEQVVGIRVLIRSFSGTKTVLFSSHILSEIEAVCSRIIVLNRGRVAAAGTPETLTARLGAGHRIVLRVDAPRAMVLEALAAIDLVSVAPSAGGPDEIIAEVKDSDVAGRAIFEAISARGWTLLELRHETLPLEQIFLRLVGGASEGSP